MSYGKYYQNSSDAAALTNQGLNRAAISKWDSSAGITLMSRMVTRGLCHSPKEQDALRQHLFNYAITDFRDKLEFIVSWLTEEWYFEYVEMKDTINLLAIFWNSLFHCYSSTTQSGSYDCFLIFRKYPKITSTGSAVFVLTLTVLN
jgi:hypothetical protein